MAQDEIERRFLVDPSKIDFEHLFMYDIVQGYLNATDTHVSRVRSVISNGLNLGYLTIKSQVGQEEGTTREFEYQIPYSDSVELMGLCGKLVLEKVRYLYQPDMETPLVHVPIWEIDVFKNALEGVCIAEIELPHKDFEIDIPEFVIMEITGNKALSNFRMAQYPELAKAEVAFLLKNKL